MNVMNVVIIGKKDNMWIFESKLKVILINKILSINRWDKIIWEYFMIDGFEGLLINCL